MKSMWRPMVLVVVALSLDASAGCVDPKAKSRAQRRADRVAKWRAQGRAEAERDLAARKLRIKLSGLPPAWLNNFCDMASKKFGVDFETVADCVVDSELGGRTDGYNELMEREIVRRFGRGALERVIEAAREQYQKERQNGRGIKP